MHKRLLFCAAALLLCLGASGLSVMAQDMGDNGPKKEDPKPDAKKEAPKGDGIKRKDVPDEYAKMKAPDLKDEKTVDAGKKTYEKKCAGCHGAEGQSDGKYSDRLDPKATKLASADFQDAVTDQYIFWRIKTGKESYGGEGKSKMKSFGSLKEKDIWEVVAFVRSLKAEKVEVLNGNQWEDLMHDFKSSGRALASAGHDKEKATKAADGLLKIVPKLKGYNGTVHGGDHDGENVRDQDNWKAAVKKMQDAADDYAAQVKAEKWDKADAARKDIGGACESCHHEFKRRHR